MVYEWCGGAGLGGGGVPLGSVNCVNVLLMSACGAGAWVSGCSFSLNCISGVYGVRML